MNAKRYQDAVGEIVDIARQGDLTRTVLEVDRVEGGSLWPSNLFDRAEPSRNVLELHKLLQRQGEILTYESYDLDSPLPAKGGQYIFRSMWTPDVLDIVLNTELAWKRELYPDNGSHDHCPLTWKTICSYTGEREGYRSGSIWISVDAYERYIRNDILRVRRRAMP